VGDHHGQETRLKSEVCCLIVVALSSWLFGRNCAVVITQCSISNHFYYQWIGRQNRQFEIECLPEWSRCRLFVPIYTSTQQSLSFIKTMHAPFFLFSFFPYFLFEDQDFVGKTFIKRSRNKNCAPHPLLIGLTPGAWDQLVLYVYMISCTCTHVKSPHTRAGKRKPEGGHPRK